MTDDFLRRINILHGAIAQARRDKDMNRLAMLKLMMNSDYELRFVDRL